MITSRCLSIWILAKPCSILGPDSGTTGYSAAPPLGNRLNRRTIGIALILCSIG
jgi:hypothetical protein